jgi:membrane fusion protein (multidrug efflux system)
MQQLKYGARGFAAAFLWVGAAAAQPIPSVGFVVASAQPVYDEHSYVGRIQSPEVVQLQARVTGYLTAQNFRDGDAVHKGELLYVIEQPPYQALLAQAQASVAQAQAQARNADLTLERAQKLLHTAAGQQSQVDAAEATALSDHAAILAAQAQAQTAAINLGYTEIRAPVDGVIGATTVNVGNVVGPTSGVLATIVSEDPMYVTFSLPSVDAIQAKGQSDHLIIAVQLPDGAVYGQIAKVDFINNQVTASTDTLAWRATIANPAHALTDGEFVTVKLRDATAKPEIVLPLAAVIADQLGSYVLTLDEHNVVRRQTVTLGAQTDTTVAITAGLSPGARVITQGTQRVHPGLTVDPAPASS